MHAQGKQTKDIVSAIVSYLPNYKLESIRAKVKTFRADLRKGEVAIEEQPKTDSPSSGKSEISQPQKLEKAQPTTLELVQSDIANRKDKAKIRELGAKYDHVLKELEEADKRYDALLGIKESVDITQIDFLQDSKKDSATAYVLLSDWHSEEKVEANTINGINEYNLDIATHRINKCIQNSLKLVHKERHSAEIKTLVVWLGGDFMTGYIHEEGLENNYLSPHQAILFVKERLIASLKFYLEHGKFDQIRVICNVGNHGRSSHRMKSSTGYKNSFEWAMYHDIASYFQGNKKIEFSIPNGLLNYFTVYDQFTVRTFHGDHIGYGGGIGGLTVPLIKAIMRMNQQQHADYNFMGHFHQLWQATKDCTVNGSLIGFNSYAQRINASPERPMQGFGLIDRKYGMTTRLPIFCE